MEIITFNQVIEKFKPSFVFDEENKKIIEQFEILKTENSLKGLLIIGGTGTGKTCLMKLYKEWLIANHSFSFKVVNVRDICFDFMAKGYSEIEKYYRYGDYNYTYPAICIDDLGAENPASNYYGTTEDVISNLLYLRSEQHAKTFATTNLSVDLLKKRYGERLFDRFNQIFELAYLTGNSKR